MSVLRALRAEGIELEYLEDPTHGIEGKYKRGSRNDYFIVPLGSALQSWRDSDKRIRMATGKDPTHSEAILIAMSHH